MTIQFISITPYRTSSNLDEDDNVFDSYMVKYKDEVGEHTTFIPSKVFSHEYEEAECALGGLGLITSLVDRWRAQAAL